MKASNKPNRYTLALATRLALAAMASAAVPVCVAAEAAAQASYSIPAGNLANQLKAFSKQSGIQIRAAGVDLAGKNGAAINGNFTPQQALDRLLAGSGLVASASANGFALSEAQTSLATVMVTGEKISRSLKDTNTAVTVIRKPQDLNVRSVYDAIVTAPNTLHTDEGIPTVRGVAGSGPAVGKQALGFGAQPRLNISIDGVSESWAGQRYIDAGLWDVQQVEVLRGPQSTTQGRNSIAGAVVMTTKDPSFDWEGAIRTGFESEKNKNVGAFMLSGPILDDQLAFRITGEGSRGNNFIDYSESRPITWDPGYSSSSNFRGKLLWQPHALPGFTAKFTASHRKDVGAYLNRAIGNPSELKFYGDGEQVRAQDSSNNATVTDLRYEFNPAWSAQVSFATNNNLTQFRANDNTLMKLRREEFSKSLEARVNYNPENGPLKAVIGSYWFDRDQYINVYDTKPTIAPVINGPDKMKTVALFGEASYDITPAWQLQIGGRVENDKQKRDVHAWDGDVKTDIDETMFLPKLGVNYKLDQQTTLGLSARKGYAPGAGALDDDDRFYEYNKETVNTYEFSTRSNLLDDRLSLNSNWFYNQYTDLQAANGGKIINVPKARSYGLEVEAAGKVQKDLEVFGSVGFLNTRITETPDFGPDVNGKAFSLAPNMTASLGFRKQWSNGVFFGSDIRHTGSFYSNISNDSNTKIDHVNVWNANLGYKHKAFTVRGYVNNITNSTVIYKQSLRNIRGGGQVLTSSVGAPRTVGVVFDYNFL